MCSITLNVGMFWKNPMTGFRSCKLGEFMLFDSILLLLQKYSGYFIQKLSFLFLLRLMQLQIHKNRQMIGRIAQVFGVRKYSIVFHFNLIADKNVVDSVF